MMDAPSGSVLLLTLCGSAQQVRQALEEDGLWVSVVSDAANAARQAQNQQPDLVVVQLDGRQPEDWQVCLRLRETIAQPLLVLVADQSVEARLAALASGANDVLSEPFHPLELAARAQALRRRQPLRDSTSHLLRHAELELDAEGHLATMRGRPLPLTPLEFRLLRTLLENPQRTFRRDELLARVHVFDDRFSSERSIDLHVAELRRKLGDSPAAPRYVETVRGIGYRLAPAPETADPPSDAPCGELHGKVALVTGGSRGIGRAIVEALAGAGAAVAIMARSEPEVRQAEQALRQRGRAALGLSGDVTIDEHVRRAVATTIEQLGGLDILVCNAGMAASVPTHRMDDELWQRLLSVNLSGAFYVTRAALPHLLQQQRGRIIMIASTAAKVGLAYSAGYCAAKHGLLGLTRALALELAQKGITVNAVCPSFVATEMTQQTAQTIADKTGRSTDDAIQLLANMSPQRRLIEPEEVARVVMMLAGEGANGITGQAINVDGGSVMS